MPKTPKAVVNWIDSQEMRDALGDATLQALDSGCYIGFSKTRTGDLSITVLKDGAKEKAYAESPGEVVEAVLEALEALAG